jgi:tetratricopeptide (TPR) repeat protein
MKKLLFLLLPLLFFVNCSTLRQENRDTGRKGVPAVDPGDVAVNSGNDWLFYSHGLNYKLSALNSADATGRENLMRKALQCFFRAAGSGRSLDRVYYHVSDCFYYLNDFTGSLDYARRSIEKNPRQLDPYNRIYSIHIRMKNDAGAAKILEEYCSVNPNSMEVQFALAEHYLKRMNDPEKSRASLMKVLKLFNETANEVYYRESVYYYLGYISYQQNRIDEAIGYYESAYALNTGNLKTVYMLALLNMEQSRLEKAALYARIYLATYPDNYVQNGILGQILYLREDGGALKHLRTAKNDGSINGIISHGLYLELLHRDMEAKQLLKSVERYSPNAITVHLAMARIHEREKDMKASFNELVTAGVLAYKNSLGEIARRCFSQALAIDGAVAEVYYYLGRVYEDRKDYSMALVNYRKVDELKPSVDMTIHIGFVYGLRKDYDRAFRYLDAASEKEPDNSQPYFYRGLVCMWKEDYSPAEKNMLRAVDLDPDQDTYYFYLAMILEKREKISDAIQWLEKALEKNPDSARINNYLGYLYADHNMSLERSHDLIKKALEKEPDNGAYLDSMGWVYFRKGMYTEALEKLLEAEKQLDASGSPDSAVYDHIGDTYMKLGNPAKALAYWKKALQLEDVPRIREKIKGVR